jgi:hypothetical protein
LLKVTFQQGLWRQVDARQTGVDQRSCLHAVRHGERLLSHFLLKFGQLFYQLLGTDKKKTLFLIIYIFAHGYKLEKRKIKIREKRKNK